MTKKVPERRALRTYPRTSPKNPKFQGKVKKAIPTRGPGTESDSPSFQESPWRYALIRRPSQRTSSRGKAKGTGSNEYLLTQMQDLNRKTLTQAHCYKETQREPRSLTPHPLRAVKPSPTSSAAKRSPLNQPQASPAAEA